MEKSVKKIIKNNEKMSFIQKNRTARRITFNFVSLSISELIAKLLQLFVFVYIARVYGKTDFGNFGFAIAFSAILAVLADFGISSLLIREISRDKNLLKKYFSNAFWLKIFLGVLTFLLAIAFLNLIGYSHEAKVIAYLLLFFYVFQSFTDLFYSAFRAFERMHFDSSIKVLRMLVLSILIFVLIKNNAGFIIVGIAFPLVEFAMLVISSLIYVKYFDAFSFEYDFSVAKKILKGSFPFFVSLIFVTLLVYIDIVLLERFKGPEEVGIYAAAYNILFGLSFIPLMFSNSVYPVFSRYFKSDESLLNFAYRKSLAYMLILGLPASVGIWVYSDKIINLVYGTGYEKSVLALQILCWFVFLRFVNIIPGTALSAIDRQSSRTICQAAVALLNIGLNIFLIPKYGFVGAAYSAIISEAFFIILYAYFTRKYGMKLNIFQVAAKPVIASIVMYLIISRVENVFLGTLIGIVSYFVALLVLKTFSSEDKKLIMRIIKNA